MKNFHRLRSVSLFQCPRCKECLPTKEAYDEHLARDFREICNVKPGPVSINREDGISPTIEDVLNERRSDSKVDSWESLWRTLFPEDEIVPEPGKPLLNILRYSDPLTSPAFVPVVESLELEKAFDHKISSLTPELGRRISDLVPEPTKSAVLAEIEGFIDGIRRLFKEPQYPAAFSQDRVR